MTAHASCTVLLIFLGVLFTGRTLRNIYLTHRIGQHPGLLQLKSKGILVTFPYGLNGVIATVIWVWLFFGPHTQ
jgi:hypothetical protein